MGDRRREGIVIIVVAIFRVWRVKTKGETKRSIGGLRRDKGERVVGDELGLMPWPFGRRAEVRISVDGFKHVEKFIGRALWERNAQFAQISGSVA